MWVRGSAVGLEESSSLAEPRVQDTGRGPEERASIRPWWLLRPGTSQGNLFKSQARH